MIWEIVIVCEIVTLESCYSFRGLMFVIDIGVKLK